MLSKLKKRRAIRSCLEGAIGWRAGARNHRDAILAWTERAGARGQRVGKRPTTPRESGASERNEITAVVLASRRYGSWCRIAGTWLDRDVSSARRRRDRMHGDRVCEDSARERTGDRSVPKGASSRTRAAHDSRGLFRYGGAGTQCCVHAMQHAIEIPPWVIPRHWRKKLGLAAQTEEPAAAHSAMKSWTARW